MDSTEEQVAAFAARLESFLGKNVRKILKGIIKGETSALEAANILGGLQSALEDAGLSQELAQITKIYGKELKIVREEFAKAKGKIVYSDSDLQTVEALISFDADVVTTHVSQYVNDIKSTIMNQVIIGSSPDIEALHDAFGGTLQNKIDTELNTSLAGFSRTITLSKAEDAGLNYFRYAGPNDGRTRPFCRERVGKIFTKDEIMNWDNGQGLPADVYLGGYNCRHRLQPITKERALESGYQL